MRRKRKENENSPTDALHDKTELWIREDDEVRMKWIPPLGEIWERAAAIAVTQREHTHTHTHTHTPQASRLAWAHSHCYGHRALFDPELQPDCPPAKPSALEERAFIPPLRGKKRSLIFLYNLSIFRVRTGGTGWFGWPGSDPLMNDTRCQTPSHSCTTMQNQTFSWVIMTQIPFIL